MPLTFLGDSLDIIRRFDRAVRLQLGRELRRIQNGEQPKRWKPMTRIGPGVREIRISHQGEFRVLYVVRQPEAVYVLHAFQKKSQKTAREDIERARRRLKGI